MTENYLALFFTHKQKEHFFLQRGGAKLRIILEKSSSICSKNIHICFMLPENARFLCKKC